MRTNCCSVNEDKMRNKIIIIFLTLFQINQISCAGDKTVSATPPESSRSQAIPTLPLVLIRYGLSTVHPRELVTPVETKQRKILSGGTIFSHGDSKDTIYLCARGPFTKEGTSKTLPTKLPETDDRYCSYPTKFQNTEPLQCVHDPEPFVEEIRFLNEPKYLACGPESRGKMYRFVYMNCFEENTDRYISFLKNPLLVKSSQHKDKSEIYRFCVNEQGDKILYTSHRTLSPSLLGDDNLKQERLKEYPMMTDGYGSINSYVEKIQEEYKMFDNPPKNEDPRYQKSPQFDPTLYKIQKVVPPDHLAFALWRKPTYHVLNTRPMRKDLAELWDYIDRLILRSSTKDKREYQIYTRVFSSYDQEDVPATQSVPKVPNIWLKYMVHYYLSPAFDGSLRVDSLVIMVADNVDENFVKNIFQGTCTENLCENAFSHRFHDDITKSVRCCNWTDDIRKFFNTGSPMLGHLDPDFLFERLDDSEEAPKTEE